MSAPPLPGTTRHSSASLFSLAFPEDLRLTGPCRVSIKVGLRVY